MSASARVTLAPAEDARSAFAPLAVILGAGLILRLLFLGSTGFHNDVAAFESWTLTLRDAPPWAFYAKTGFADYPPGYFVVLWLVGKLYALAPGAGLDAMHGWALLRAFVKLPAIVMDLVDAGVVFAIVRRYASPSIALFAAAALALNPAAIYVSAYWGQVDSVSWGLVLIALFCVLRAGDDPTRTVPRLTWAWLAFAFSILIKPQAATIGLLFLAYPFATSDAAVRARRLAGTAAGLGAAAGLALIVGLLFHPSADVLGWLFGRYQFGSAVYAYNSVNAFNLYALRQPFWQSDATTLTFFGVGAGPLSVWGIALVVAATALIVGRYLQRRDDRALLEAAMLCAFAFFVLATRMHERYVYGAFLLAMPLIAFGRIGLVPSVVLTVTMYLNLAYSLAYQTVMELHTTGVDATDLWPAVSHPAALANVALFFWLGYRFLGAAPEAAPAAPATLGGEFAAVRGLLAHGRAWFDPREGIVAMTRLDWLLAGAFTVGAFVLAVLWVQWPAEKYLRRDLLRAGRRRISQAPGRQRLGAVRVHPSAADEARHHALDDVVRRPARRRGHGPGLAFPQRRRRCVDGRDDLRVRQTVDRFDAVRIVRGRDAGARRVPLRAIADRNAGDHGRVSLAGRALRVLSAVAGVADRAAGCIVVAARADRAGRDGRARDRCGRHRRRR